ncbi:hypothetical protein [Pseudomonas kermanshahensis]
MPSNMERFDQLTGAIFARLYETFPEPVKLDDRPFLDLIAPDGQDLEVQSSQAFYAPEFFVHTVRWLAQTGYLTYTANQRDEYLIQDCVLTAKGLEVLKATPDSLGGKTLGSQLQDAAEAGLIDTVKSLAGKALGVGASMTYTAASSWLQNQ